MRQSDDYAKAYGITIVAFSVAGIIFLLAGSAYIEITGNYPVDPELLKKHIWSLFK